MFIWYVIAVVLFLIATCEFYTLKTGVPTVTSTPAVRRKMVEILRQEQQSKGTPAAFSVLDLGSGTGKLALEIGRGLPAAQVAGLEISLTPFLLSCLRRAVWRALWQVKNVAFKREDFWPYDVSNIDAVVLYMNGKIRERMAEKLKKELKPGTLVISNETHLPGWEPFETYTVGLLRVKVVVYRRA